MKAVLFKTFETVGQILGPEADSITISYNITVYYILVQLPAGVKAKYIFGTIQCLSEQTTGDAFSLLQLKIQITYIRDY